MQNRKIERKEVKRTRPASVPVNMANAARRIPLPLHRCYPLRIRQRRWVSLSLIRQLM